MTGMADTVVRFDVDNILLDNDRLPADVGVHLAKYYGEQTLGDPVSLASIIPALGRGAEPKLAHDRSNDVLINSYRRLRE